MLVYKNMIADMDIFDEELHIILRQSITSIFFWVKSKDNKASFLLEGSLKIVTTIKLIEFIKSKYLNSMPCLLPSNYILSFNSLLSLVGCYFACQFKVCKRTLILYNE